MPDKYSNFEALARAGASLSPQIRHKMAHAQDSEVGR
jgi:hypothetical protein